ncbi:mitochondrial carrier [Atractiella rhizophila]|nr:mitochondrial carrier [Atractiella rhizophila]
MHESPPRLSGLGHAFSTILKTEGLGTLWRGVGTALAISVPSQAIYMVGYDWLRYRLLHEWRPSWSINQKGGTKKGYETLSVLFAGSFTRSAIVTLFSPLELIRTRLQYQPHENTWGEIIRTALRDQANGGRMSVWSLWRGLPPTLWRDVPFSAIYWVGYETLKKSLTGKGMGEGWKDEEMGKSSALNRVWGRFAATLTNAFDVVKTRRQALSHSVVPSNGMKADTTTFGIIREIFRTEGIAGLQRGLSPRLARVGPACAIIMIGSYEGLGGWLEERFK